MAKLIYTVLTSLDGYIEDDDGKFDWVGIDHEVHAFVNDLTRPIGTEIYGRRMYETMAVWQTIDEESADSAEEVDFGNLWRSLDKVVYSTTLDAVSTPRTRLERTFDPDAVRDLKESADRDLSIGGPTLAEHAFRAGLVDEVHLFASPVVVGGGKPGLPRGVRLDLELVGERRFANGVVHLHHRAR